MPWQGYFHLHILLSLSKLEKYNENIRNQNIITILPFQARFLSYVPVITITGVAYRVAGGGSNFYGRAEIRIGGVWGTICDNYWDAKEANVFCRQLNFSDGVAISRARYGQGSGPIWLSHLQCTGNEKYFHECPHRGFKDLYSAPSFGWPFTLPCTSHKDDASVFCYKSGKRPISFCLLEDHVFVFNICVG